MLCIALRFLEERPGDAVLDWQDTCKAVEAGVQATIERARREGIDLILEGFTSNQVHVYYVHGKIQAGLR